MYSEIHVPLKYHLPLSFPDSELDETTKLRFETREGQASTSLFYSVNSNVSRPTLRSSFTISPYISVSTCLSVITPQWKFTSLSLFFFLFFFNFPSLFGVLFIERKMLSKGLFTRRWGTPGRWGNLLRWGNSPVHIISHFNLISFTWWVGWPYERLYGQASYPT